MTTKNPMRLFGHDVTITVSDPGQWASNALGRSNIAKNEIMVSSQIDDSVQHSTLLHEVLHRILDHNGLTEASHDEKLVCVLETGLFTFMRDNPRLIMEMSGFAPADAVLVQHPQMEA